MRPTITEEPTKDRSKDYLHNNITEYPAWTEVGKAGSKVHIPFHPQRVVEAKENVDNCLLVRDYALNGYLLSEERMILVGTEVNRIIDKAKK